VSFIGSIPSVSSLMVNSASISCTNIASLAVSDTSILSSVAKENSSDFEALCLRLCYKSEASLSICLVTV
jgi:hypothetical protein